MSGRERKFGEAIREATEIAMERDPRVYVMGLGVPDPKGIFGTTLGLRERFGPSRVLDMPTSENAMTGVALGSALVGMRPLLTHQRVEFALLSLDPLVNQAAKWRYMFGGRSRAPIVVRLIVGRGWGQGPQHSQSLHAWFAHIPGLKVVLPATAHDAKGLLIAALEDDDPVLFIEHRWLHNTFGPVPEGHYTVPIGPPRLARPGAHLTIAACSYMVLEALAAAHMLAGVGIEAEVIDLRTIAPYDGRMVADSLRKTGHLLVADTSWTAGGFSAEVVADAVEREAGALRSAPRRAGLAPCPVPTTPALARHCYPRARELAAHALSMLGREGALPLLPEPSDARLDVPDPSFTGPF